MRSVKYIPIIVVAQEHDNFIIRQITKVNGRKDQVINKFKDVLENYSVPNEVVESMSDEVLTNITFGMKVNKGKWSSNNGEKMYLKILWKGNDMQMMKNDIVKQEGYNFYQTKK